MQNKCGSGTLRQGSELHFSLFALHTHRIRYTLKKCIKIHRIRQTNCTHGPAEPHARSNQTRCQNTMFQFAALLWYCINCSNSVKQHGTCEHHHKFDWSSFTTFLSLKMFQTNLLTKQDIQKHMTCFSSDGSIF